MQIAGIDGEQVYFLLEDHQLVDINFLDMVNSLLSSGEVSFSTISSFFHDTFAACTYVF